MHGCLLCCLNHCLIAYLQSMHWSVRILCIISLVDLIERLRDELCSWYMVYGIVLHCLSGYDSWRQDYLPFIFMGFFHLQCSNQYICIMNVQCNCKLLFPGCLHNQLNSDYILIPWAANVELVQTIFREYCEQLKGILLIQYAVSLHNCMKSVIIYYYYDFPRWMVAESALLLSWCE